MNQPAERPTYTDVVAAATRIAPHVHRTPAFTSATIDRMVDARVVFKAENLQKVGAFKARGATNAVFALSDQDAARGVVTHSSGNHGQALAFAAALRGIAATIVMPDHAPQVKVDAVRGYGASVVTVPNADRETATDRIISETGAVLVHPFEHPDVVAGQGTASLELLDDRPDIEVVVTPVGGGGLLSGTSLVTDHRGVGAVGVEPELVDDAARSLRDGVRHPATGAMSVGDGLLGRMGALAFAMLRDAAVEMVTVSEPQIMDAVRLHAQRMKLVVEPSGATVLAALLAHPDRFAGRTVGAVISGGNLDLELLGTS